MENGEEYSRAKVNNSNIFEDFLESDDIIPENLSNLLWKQLKKISEGKQNDNKAKLVCKTIQKHRFILHFLERSYTIAYQKDKKQNRNIITKNGENDGGNHEEFRRTPQKTFGNFSRILAMTWYLSFEKLMVGFPFSLTKLPHSSLRISEKM